MRSGDAPSEEMSAMVLWHESACGGADVDSGAVHTVEVAAANEADIKSCPSYCGRKTKLYLAMRATPAMNINADHGSWECAGVCKTNVSPDRISR